MFGCVCLGGGIVRFAQATHERQHNPPKLCMSASSAPISLPVIASPNPNQCGAFQRLYIQKICRQASWQPLLWTCVVCRGDVWIGFRWWEGSENGKVLMLVGAMLRGTATEYDISRPTGAPTDCRTCTHRLCACDTNAHWQTGIANAFTFASPAAAATDVVFLPEQHPGPHTT